MDAIIVRLEVGTEEAELLLRIIEEFHSGPGGVLSRLAGNPPIHTRARLEEQREKIETIQRAMTLAIANPDLVEIPDPSEG